MDTAGSGNLTDSCGGDGSSGEGGLGEVLAGVAIAVVASVGINIGNNVQVLAGLRCIRSQGGLGWPGAHMCWAGEWTGWAWGRY